MTHTGIILPTEATCTLPDVRPGRLNQRHIVKLTQIGWVCRHLWVRVLHS